MSKSNTLAGITRDMTRYIGQTHVTHLRRSMHRAQILAAKNNPNMAQAIYDLAKILQTELAPVLDLTDQVIEQGADELLTEEQARAAIEAERIAKAEAEAAASGTELTDEDKQKATLNFDTKEELVEFLELPATRAKCKALKVGKIVDALYEPGNEDALEDLGLPTAKEDLALTKPMLLDLLYGGKA